MVRGKLSRGCLTPVRFEVMHGIASEERCRLDAFILPLTRDDLPTGSLRTRDNVIAARDHRQPSLRGLRRLQMDRRLRGGRDHQRRAAGAAGRGLRGSASGPRTRHRTTQRVSQRSEPATFFSGRCQQLEVAACQRRGFERAILNGGFDRSPGHEEGHLVDTLESGRGEHQLGDREPCSRSGPTKFSPRSTCATLSSTAEARPPVSAIRGSHPELRLLLGRPLDQGVEVLLERGSPGHGAVYAQKPLTAEQEHLDLAARLRQGRGGGRRTPQQVERHVSGVDRPGTLIGWHPARRD